MPISLPSALPSAIAHQKRLGVIPANTQLTPWPDTLS
jgi:hypothetical protein